ncbi:LysM peptidoglycan-binding domain-containing protein [Desulfovibrio sp. TomC]|uniref:LysM peptidoglycan-binding domain-containing protein n=1 Tax=Desulfovibrio sp. TomC TaxID=1562888 RepID=UPI00057303E9|nr:LysM peptidoglycan-binding domain-containing protein [Desulfovibrio sp. TomC]KHK03613.1 Membrane-bound lytic murein transglycosylase D precursor [Desulfovibrio sp. TomC]
MGRYLLFVLLPAFLLLSGCSGKQYDKSNADMKANLEPELWDTSQILKNLQRGRPLTEQEKKALASRGAIQFDLDVKENEEVQVFLQYFSIDKRGSMDTWLRRAEPHLPYVRAVLASYNLPPDLIALPFIESGYNTMAYSPVGAGGMWQFMPYTGRRFGLTVDWWVDERRDPYKSTVAAAKYLTKLYQMFGDWNLALAAYNAGEGKISRVMAASGQCDFFDIAKDPKLLKDETRHYVPKFLAVLKIFQNLDTLGFKKVNWQAGPNLKEVPAPGGTDLAALAQACSMPWEQFREYNPGFRRQVSPPDMTVNVYVPVAKEQVALAFLNNPGNYPPVGGQTYTAEAGDTWWNIARKSGMPVAELRQLNASLPETLPPGQTVRVALSASGADNSALAEGPDACAPKPFAAAKPQRHRVSKGDSVGSVARKYGVSTQELLAANKMKHAGRLTQGSWLNIPGGQAAAPAQAAAGVKGNAPVSLAEAEASHTVAKGETVGSIAAKHGVSPQELMAANSLRSPKELLVGKRLSIPKKPGSKAPEPAAPAPVQTASAGSYTVKAGDTAHSIARSQGIDPKQLAAANPGRLDKLRPGDRLTLPGGSKAPAPAPVQAAAAPAPREPAKYDKAAKPAAAPQPPVAKTFAQAAPQPAPAPAAKPQAAKPASKSVNYKVSPGDTLWGIAKKFNVDPSSLMAWNNMKSSSSLQTGAQLTIHQ